MGSQLQHPATRVPCLAYRRPKISMASASQSPTPPALLSVRARVWKTGPTRMSARRWLRTPLSRRPVDGVPIRWAGARRRENRPTEITESEGNTERALNGARPRALGGLQTADRAECRGVEG